MTGKKFSSDFATRTGGSTENFLGASLGLIAADTRGGLSPETQKHLAVVESASGGNARRQDYVSKYRKASGQGAYAGAPGAGAGSKLDTM